jgi:NCS1 family nucleobase:cation symporter-1
VVLWQTGVVHLFFLAVPAWVLSGVLYLVLAKKGNGGGSMTADAPSDSAADAAPYQPLIETTASGPEGTPSFVKAAGLVALLALVTCVALPVWVLLAAEAERASRIGPFKTWLLVASLVYFVAGSLWIYRRPSDVSAA